MAITNHMANRILDYNFGSTSYTVPPILYIGLSTTALSSSGGGYTEPSGAGYARVAYANNKTNFSISSNGLLTNLVSVIFNESTASWGTVTYVFISDAASGGNILYYEALNTPRAVATNTTIMFSPNALSISMVN